MFPIQKLVERFENYTLLVTSAQKTRVGEKKAKIRPKGAKIILNGRNFSSFSKLVKLNFCY